MKIRKRKIWKNYVWDQTIDPLKYFKPTCLADLITIVKSASTRGYHVKPIGSGHSSSDIALSTDYMIDTHGLDRMLNTNLLSLRPGAVGAPGAAGALEKPGSIVLVECGIRLHALNKLLDDQGMALYNMGAYTGQTLAGVVSTSTHGSGISLGAFPEYVEAIVLLGEDGELYHLERSGDRALSTAPIRLDTDVPIHFVQSDEDFLAAGVSMGCMGIIYAVALRVRSSYMLNETRSFGRWSEVRQLLEKGDVLRDNRHYEVLINPYRYKGRDYKCLVTARNIEEKIKKGPLIPRGHRKLAYELPLLLVPDFILNALMRMVINWFPRFVPDLVQMLISTLTVKGYIDKSYKVLDLGKANNLAAYATEIAFPEHRYLDAVDAIIDIVAKDVAEGRQYLSAPFSLRFVRTNAFPLAMQYGKLGSFVCMIEFPTVNRTIGGMETLSRIESAMYAFGGIPHWGQVNHVGGTGKASLARLYPEFNNWLSVYRKYCRKGMFENDFTRRCGISAVDALLFHE
ncbi:MAG TPA: D-arabinono-1,4-lactone oxidase [Puia sp.]|nr:D-arabinono-1,4-lactone oxidase [Puia sp.]